VNAIQTEPHHYKHGALECEGYLAYDGATYAKRPGILIIHDAPGQNPFVRRRAVLLARLGYAALVLDLYGGGKLAKDAAEADALSGGLLAEPEQLRERAKAGLDSLRTVRCAESRSTAVIGYGFGGSAALEMARAGHDLRGVASFHGPLASRRPAEPGAVKGRVLVLHGADDARVPPAQVQAFQDEMRRAGADWQMSVYGGAASGFTNPESGAAYSEAADRRSWQALKDFFTEIF
jgi:dienelactone hydrolase